MASELKAFAIPMGNKMKLIDRFVLELPLGELLGELIESGLVVLKL